MDIILKIKGYNRGKYEVTHCYVFSSEDFFTSKVSPFSVLLSMSYLIVHNSKLDGLYLSIIKDGNKIHERELASRVVLKKRCNFYKGVIQDDTLIRNAAAVITKLLSE